MITTVHVAISWPDDENIPALGKGPMDDTSERRPTWPPRR